jgi:C-8 sterol isomerase
MCQYLVTELDKRYHGYINPKINWVFNNAGGAMGAMTLLHGSLQEYLIIFGTPIGTEGHSGRYRADVYDWMIDGEMWYYREDHMKRIVVRPGQLAHLPKGMAKGYCIKDHAWMLEYARGSIPGMLPFGLADSLVSTVDYRTLGRTVKNFGSQVIKNLFLRGKDVGVVIKFLCILVIAGTLVFFLLRGLGL